MEKNNLFSLQILGKGITRITGAGNELMYLIEGNDRAALIDTGIGVGNIKEYVESLTKLPIIVILTHAHIDHSAGAFLFDEVYLHDEDALLLDLEFNENECKIMHQGIIDFVANSNKSLAMTLQKSDLVRPYRKQFLPIKNGDVYELGNMTLEILECPGHTKGSVMILIKESKVIIFGDSCNPSVWMFLPESTSLAVYKESLIKIYRRRGEYDKVLLSHYPNDAPKELLDNILHLCDDIIEERLEGEKEPLMGDKVYIAQNTLPSKLLENHMPVSILYKRI